MSTYFKNIMKTSSGLKTNNREIFDHNQSFESNKIKRNKVKFSNNNKISETYPVTKGSDTKYYYYYDRSVILKQDWCIREKELERLSPQERIVHSEEVMLNTYLNKFIYKENVEHQEPVYDNFQFENNEKYVKIPKIMSFVNFDFIKSSPEDSPGFKLKEPVDDDFYEVPDDVYLNDDDCDIDMFVFDSDDENDNYF